MFHDFISGRHCPVIRGKIAKSALRTDAVYGRMRFIGQIPVADGIIQKSVHICQRKLHAELSPCSDEPRRVVMDNRTILDRVRQIGIICGKYPLRRKISIQSAPHGIVNLRFVHNPRPGHLLQRHTQHLSGTSALCGNCRFQPCASNAEQKQRRCRNDCIAF